MEDWKLKIEYGGLNKGDWIRGIEHRGLDDVLISEPMEIKA